VLFVISCHCCCLSFPVIVCCLSFPVIVCCLSLLDYRVCVFWEFMLLIHLILLHQTCLVNPDSY
jgi:hypothetical protein